MTSKSSTPDWIRPAFLFIGFAIVAALYAASPAVKAQTYMQLNALTPSAGSEPAAGLLQDATGNLYGTTQYGGKDGYGTVFERTASGQLTTLYSFKGQGDGGRPASTLILGTDGNVYGTTQYGGDMRCTVVTGQVGCSVVFRLTPSGQETPLHVFKGYPSDGSLPVGGLVLNSTTGIAYGATGAGGRGSLGTAYTINLSTGEETVLYNCNEYGGGTPTGPLVMDATGNLYGVGEYGTGDLAEGELFKLTPTGEEITLEDMDTTFGNYPTGTLAIDAEGNLYGATSQGGNEDKGIVFEYTSVLGLTVLHSFTGTGTDGSTPYGGVTLGSNGDLYGTTYSGGRSNLGTVYQIVLSAGTYSTMYSFRGFTRGNPDGEYPAAPVILGPTGTLYGTTEQGGNPSCTTNGAAGCGEIFQIVP
jgi:uncharacterized repeat protein (TIGR03803 family)